MTCFVILASLSGCHRVFQSYFISKASIDIGFLFFHYNISTFLLLFVNVNNFCIYVCPSSMPHLLMVVRVIFLSHFALSATPFISFQLTEIFKILRLKQCIEVKNRSLFKMPCFKVESSCVDSSHGRSTSQSF